MSKNITFNPSSIDKLKVGVDIISNTVKSTLGPRGRNVIIESQFGGAPFITKDGANVAKEIVLKDPIENLAAQVIKQAAMKTVAQCGDGTTTATVLAQALFNEAYKYIQLGVISPIEMKRGLEAELPKILDYIKSISSKIDDPIQLEQVATISANNDPELGKLIAEAFASVGENGIVLAEESKSASTYVELTEGAKIDRGYISPYFVNTDKMTCELEDCLILFYDKKIRGTKEIAPALGISQRANKPLLIIAEEVESQALSVMVINRMRVGLSVAAIKTPAFGERRTKILEDLAILTGGKLITENSGKTLEQVTLEDLGRVEKAVISRTETTLIVSNNANKEAIAKRVDLIRLESEQSESEYEIAKNKERIATLIGKVAVVHIGALTEVELKEKKDRVDDALQATQAALVAGIVPGGGSVYFNASLQEPTTIPQEVLYTALKAPLKTICENAGVSPDVIFTKVSPEEGYNAATNTIENLAKAGVIDPTLVLLCALENAISVASMLLMTSAAVTIERDANFAQHNENMDPSQYM